MKKRRVVSEFNRRRILKRTMNEIKDRMGFDPMLFVSITKDDIPKVHTVKMAQLPDGTVDAVKFGAWIGYVLKDIAWSVSRATAEDGIDLVAGFLAGLSSMLDEEVEVIELRNAELALREEMLGGSRGTRH